MATANMQGKDLTREAPRSPKVTIGGFKIIARTVLAVLVLAVAAWVLLHVIIGIVTFLAGILVVVVAVVAVIWALRVIL